VVQKCSGACVHAEGWLPTILWAGAEALYYIYRQAALSILAGNNLFRGPYYSQGRASGIHYVPLQRLGMNTEECQ
jgi:hypothetical protein